MNKGQIALTFAAAGIVTATGIGAAINSYNAHTTDTVCTEITGTDIQKNNLLEGGTIFTNIIYTADGQVLTNEESALRFKFGTKTKELQDAIQPGHYQLKLAGSNVLAANEIPAGICPILAPTNG